MTFQRVLFVELLGGIGDLLFAVPAIEAVKQSHPLAAVDVLTFAPGGELLIGDPRVHRVFLARRVTGSDAERTVRQDVQDVLAIYPYDLIISDTRHSGIHQLIEASAARRTITQLWSGTHPAEPIARLFLRRLRAEGVVDSRIGDLPIRVYLSDDERLAAQAIWSSLGVSPQRAVLLHPHAGVAVKCWPSDHFIAVGRQLVRDGWSIAVLAGDDPALAWQIATAIPEAHFLPRLALRVTAACLEGVALLVSGDTGLAHLASALGSRVIAVYGPTWSGRYGVGGRAINVQSPFECSERNPMNFTLQRCWGGGRCIVPGKRTCCEDITPESVLEAAHRLLEAPDA